MSSSSKGDGASRRTVMNDLVARRRTEPPPPEAVSPALRASVTRLIARMAAGLFAFTSGVVRNARTFHPDGRTFRATVRSLQPADPALSRASDRLSGTALMRIGMGLLKTGFPRWLAARIPDAPSIATRFHSRAGADDSVLVRRPGEDLDLLCTAGGDRLPKLIWNLATGGRKYGLDPFDYFTNVYHSETPYTIDGASFDVWIRLAPERRVAGLPRDAEGREEGLTRATTDHALVRIEAQRVGSAAEPFVPIAEIRFEEEIHIDQEALHFDPVDGRGFTPRGFFTELRRVVYPASAGRRPHSTAERVARDREGFARRLWHFFFGGGRA